VFIIGMNINRYRDMRHWWPAFRAMTRAVRELKAHPEFGLLRAEGGLFFGGPAFIQYWKSYEQLEAYARNPNAEHLPAWRAFNQAARTTDSVGTYHETYRIQSGKLRGHVQPHARGRAARRPRRRASEPDHQRAALP